MTTPLNRRAFLTRALVALGTAPLLVRTEPAQSPPTHSPVRGQCVHVPYDYGRPNVISVKWLDSNGVTRVESVEDVESVCRYGYRPTEVTTFACTSREQAMRHGRWVLMQERIKS